MDRDEIWKRYEIAIKMQDTIRMKEYNLNAKMESIQRRRRAHDTMIDNMEAVMRGLAAGLDVEELLQNMSIGHDFWPKDY